MSKNTVKKCFLYFLVLVEVLAFCLIVSGCNDSKDINEKLIATAIAFDFKDDEIISYTEFATISKSKGTQLGGSAEYTVVKAQGKTIPEAEFNLDTQIDMPGFFSGVRAIIFTESFAKQYMVEYLYRFRADESLRKKVQTVITTDDLETMFKAIHEQEDSVGFRVEGLIESLEETGKSFSRTTMRLIENVSSKYSGILISCVGLKEKEIALTGYSVVDNNNISGFIPVEESKALVFLKADKPKLTYTVPYNNNNLTIEIERKKQKITASYENGEIGFDITLDFDAELLYGNQKTPYNFEKAANSEVTETLKGMLQQEFYDAIEKAQKEYETDYLQLDDAFRIRYPAVFETMDWKSEFAKSVITVNVNVKLRTTYMMDFGALDVK